MIVEKDNVCPLLMDQIITALDIKNAKANNEFACGTLIII